MKKKHMIVAGLILCLAFSASGTSKQSANTKTLKEMLYIAESTYQEILDFISVVNSKEQQDKLLYALKYTKGLFSHFLYQTQELTKDLQGPERIYTEKINLSKAFDMLLDKKFLETEKKLKEADTLDYYRFKWFERALYIYLKAKIQLFNYYSTLQSQNATYNYRYRKYYKSFERYIADLLAFIYENKELYRENAVFIKKVFLIEDSSSGYASKDAQVLGDVDLLLEFLKGKFKDYQGLYVRFISFRQTQTGDTRDQGIILLMQYQPIPVHEKIRDVRTVEVSVQGDNLEDIITYALNQASQIMNMKTSADKKVTTLSTQNQNYKKLIQQNILLSKLAVLKAALLFKKEIKDEKEKEKADLKRKTLEVGLRLTIGLKNGR